MSKYSFLPVTIFFIFFACRQNQQQAGMRFPGPHVVPALGYEVPADSMATPVAIPVDETRLKKIPVGKPKVVPTYSNVHPAGKPTLVMAGTPRTCTPGQGGFSLPKIVPAIERPFTAGIPEVVVVKDASAKDSNPQNFSSFSKLQGLKDNMISSMLQDQAGNLWFGTYNAGVSKYDGNFFTHFTEEEGLSNNNVYSMLEDQSGNLWFGTFGGGVTKYDGRSFTHFTELEGLPNNSVMSMLEDQSGNLWFGTLGGGVCKFDGNAMPVGQASFTYFTEREGLANNDVRSILEDRSGNLWFGTAGGGISKYDGKSFTNFSEQEGLSHNIVLTILEDKSGNFWFGTSGGGVSMYEPPRAGRLGSFSHFTKNQGLSDNTVRVIVEDQSGDLWFGTPGGGTCKYNGNTMPVGQASFTHFTEREGLSDNDVRSILEDRSGNLWFGTAGGGVIKYAGKFFTHFTEKEGLPYNNVSSILQDQSGNLWFGTGNAGVSKYEAPDSGTGGSFTHYTEKEGLSNNNIPSSLEDQFGNLWFGTWGGGVNKYVRPIEGSDGFLIHFSVQEGLSSNYILSILEDQSGNLWFGTSGGGATKYEPPRDGHLGSFTHFTTKEGLSNNIVYSILEDQSGSLWFGTRGGGVSKYEPPKEGGAASFTHFTEKGGLSNNEVWGMLEDRSGNLWFGTNGGGVNMYEPAKDGRIAQYTHFTEKEGLSNNIVWRILEDRAGNLWFSTQVGLSQISTSIHEKLSDAHHFQRKSAGNGENYGFFRNYTYADGLQGVGCNALYEDNNGTIWIGGDDRLTAYHPSSAEAIADTVSPNIQLVALQLFNENIPWVALEKQRDSTLILGNGVEVGNLRFASISRWYGLPERLSLAHDNNYLTFNFVGTTMNQPQKVKYQYMLEGMDQNWSAATIRTEATYGNLPHGAYTFKVKAMNSDGYWSKEFQYPFAIRPPWWYTWWACGFYLLIFCGVLLTAHRYQSAKVVRKERERTQHKALEQAKEIKKAYDQLEVSHANLKATQSQLVLAEKMASLGELTAGIAHEIQNPLNFVNNFSELNKELADELKNEMANVELPKDVKSNLESLVEDIVQNEQKINHHGKRAGAIVKGMLQHSRSGSGAKEPTDINLLVDEYLRLAYHGFRAKNKSLPAGRASFDATMKTDYDQTIRSIDIMPQEIGRVLLNLFTNAFYAVTEKQRQLIEGYDPTVLVSTKKIKEIVEIRVEDNGNGIPNNVLDKIFQPFFTTKPAGAGTGLGLSISFDIVKAHNGQLKVETSPADQATKDGGAVFIIQLPIA